MRMIIFQDGIPKESFSTAVAAPIKHQFIAVNANTKIGL